MSDKTLNQEANDRSSRTDSVQGHRARKKLH